ncbi:MAG: hypothetical protein Q7K65_01815 [Candidatus Buchananbacteria bacterium]|nr:hypothetical protein [Candidatus Buchananbacteria bacterium]
MKWKKLAKNKFKRGVVNMVEESDKFIILLNQFNKENNLYTKETLSYNYLLPEGANWLVRLKDCKDILIEKCSYEVKNEEINYVWVDFDLQSNQVIVEVNYKDKTLKKYILLTADNIIEHYP